MIEQAKKQEQHKEKTLDGTRSVPSEYADLPHAEV